MKNAKVKKSFIALLAVMPLLSVSLPALAQRPNERERDRDRDDVRRDRDNEGERNEGRNRVIVVRDRNVNVFRFGTSFRSFNVFLGVRFTNRLTMHQRRLLERFLRSLTREQREDLEDLIGTLTPHQRALLMDFLNSLSRSQRRAFVRLFIDFHDRNLIIWRRSHRGEALVPHWFGIMGR